MTDEDIKRCKKFKHFSTGNAVFYLVVIAAYIAMFSEALIEQLMDVSISSVWLGFLLLNNKMYNVSPVLIIAIYGSILVFTGYRLYVFIPAVKRARAARASKLGSAQDFRRIKSAKVRPRRGVARSCSALYSKIMDNFGQLMDLLSDSGKVSRALKERTNNEMWTSMNRRAKSETCSAASASGSASVSASVSSRSASGSGSGRFSNLLNSTAQNNNKNSKQSLTKRSAFRVSALVVDPAVNIPPSILAMRGTGVTFIANSEADQISAKQFFDCTVDSPSLPTPSCPEDIPVVYTSSTGHGVGTRARTFKANKGVTSNPHVALQRLLSRHCLGPVAARRGDEISTFEEPEALRCTFYLSELKSHLKFILDIYYPNNSIITEDERVEVFQNFQLWWQSTRLQLRIIPRHGSVSRGDEQHRDRVSFSAFSSWFLHVSETLIVAHTTRSEPEPEPVVTQTPLPDLITSPAELPSPPIVSDRWGGYIFNLFH
jgi:hypothetical protein